MLADAGISYLDIYLAPLSAFLKQPEITDIYVNRPGEVWTEAIGGEICRHVVPDLTEALLWRLARQVAAITHQGISREHPLLAASLPGGARVQVIAPPATRNTLALAIRKHVAADLSLAGYAAAGAFAETRPTEESVQEDDELEQLYGARAWPAFLAAAVRARKTILVSGGTSTGKTTFLNALLREVDPAERLILVEDTPELVCNRERWLGLVAVRGASGEAQVDTNDLLTASLRMRPDRIILGELRGPEAFTFLRAINSGHPGSLTTIHADTSARAVEQMALLVLRSGAQLRRDEVADYVRMAVDIAVHLERRNGRRVIREVGWLKRNP